MEVWRKAHHIFAYRFIVVTQNVTQIYSSDPERDQIYCNGTERDPDLL